MRKYIHVIALALALGGCANLPNPFATYDNPVGIQGLATTEAAYGAAVSLALGYRNACAAKSIPPSCRPIVKAIQNADNYAHAQILVARAFVKNNPTIDATVVIKTAAQAVGAFQTVLTSNGVK